MTEDSRRRLAERRGLDERVYEPAEDSLLLAEAAESVLDDPALVLEVGVGSGFVAERVADATGARVVGTDVNPHACAAARERGVEAVRADLVAPFRDRTFDAVLFNPPYLPTDPDDEWDDWLEAALSGGETGRAVVEPFLDAVGRVLAPDGVVFLLGSSLMDLDAVEQRAADAGFVAREADDDSYPYERLVVLALRRSGELP